MSRETDKHSESGMQHLHTFLAAAEHLNEYWTRTNDHRLNAGYPEGWGSFDNEVEKIRAWKQAVRSHTGHGLGGRKCPPGKVRSVRGACTRRR